jgi:hypothetical protein
MKTLLVAYDLNEPGQDYAPLIAKIKSLANGYWHHLDSTWLVRTSLTTTQLRDALAVHLDKSDELLVIDVTADSAAWRGFKKSGSDWLLKYL